MQSNPVKMSLKLIGLWISVLAISWGQQSSSSLPSYYIYNLAGNNEPGFSDSPPLFSSPRGIGYDASSQSLYVADTLNNRIRKIQFQIGAQGPDGVTVTTVAGNGMSGPGSCKQPGATTESTTVSALSAYIFEPDAVVADGSGKVYIADTQNNCVRQLSGSNVITYAGDGLQGPSGESSVLGDGGPPLLATVIPGPLAFYEKTNLLITDFLRVRLIENNIITTIAGGGQQTPATSGSQSPVDVSFGQIFSIACDPNSNKIYVATDDAVYVINGQSMQFFVGGEFPMTVSNVPGGVSLRSPQAMAVDNQGNLLIADSMYNIILRVTPSGSIDAIAGINGHPGNTGDSTPITPGLATQATLNGPMGLAVDGSGNIYISDTNNDRIRVLIPVYGDVFESGKQIGDCSHKYDNSSALCSPAAGDPIDIAGGNMFYTATDYKTAGPNYLSFSRYYNSRGDPNTLAAALGVNWRSTYDRYIRIVSPSSVLAERQDGRTLTFTLNSGAWTTDTDVDLQLTQSGSTWTLTDDNDTVETYKTVGQSEAILTSIVARNGFARTLAYNGSSQLTSVTDSFGRALNFTYSGNQLHTVATPDGLLLTYGYTSPPAAPELTSVTYSTTPPARQTFLYEIAGSPSALTGIIDENGSRYATWTYDSTGRGLSSQTGNGADFVSIAYNDTDGSRTLTNALGLQEIYRFQTLQGIPKVVEIDRLASGSVAAATRKFTYDSNGYLAAETDWNGVLTQYVNNARGEPTSITEAAGTSQARTITFQYHPTFHLATGAITPGVSYALAYDPNGNLLTYTETDTTTNGAPYSTNGQTRTWTYTWAGGLLTSFQSPRTDVNEVTQFAHDSSGALTSVTNALGQVTNITQHLPGGFPQLIVDPNGVSTQLTYDARLRLLTKTIQTSAGNLTKVYAYDAAGNIVKLTLPDGASESYSYDTAHRLTGITDLLQQTIAYTLDPLEDQLQTSVFSTGAGAGYRHTSSFDSLGRAMQDIAGAGQVTGYTYDSNGNNLTVTDPLNRVNLLAYDTLGRLTQATDPAKSVSAVAYDAGNHPLAVTDANGNATTYTYDGFGDVIQQTSPDSGTTVYTYDPDGNLVQKVDATGATVNYTFDALDRLTSASYPADPSENVAYTYDQPGFGFSLGRLTTVTDAAGSLNRTYDERGNILSESRGINGATLNTSYTYDAAGRVASVSYPSGWQILNTRDAMGRITGITAQAAGGNTPVPIVSNVGYTPFGPVNSMTFGNGVTETRSFDPDYRLLTLADIGANPLQQLTYGYDEADNALSVADGITPGNSQSFRYDSLDRLTNAAGGYGASQYTYDKVGNRLTQTLAGVTSTYTYGPRSNRLTGIVANGVNNIIGSTATGSINSANPSGGSPLTMTYNQAGRLTALMAGGQPAAQYTYDAFGQRLEKIAAATGLFQYDLTGHLLEETDGQGNPLADYVYFDGRPVATISPASAQLYFLHDDRLGTPQVATDINQSVAWTAAYDPFGVLNSTPGLIVQDLRLPGQENDSDAGWYHNGYRDYVPALGRYLESDPFGLQGGLNTYAYADGNPLNEIDPMGLWTSKLYLTFGGDLHVFGGGSGSTAVGIVIGTPSPEHPGLLPIQGFVAPQLGFGAGTGGGVSLAPGFAISPGAQIEPGWERSVGGTASGQIGLGGAFNVSFPVDKNGRVDPTGWELATEFHAGPAEGFFFDYTNQLTYVTGVALPVPPPPAPAPPPLLLKTGTSVNVYLNNRPKARRRRRRRRFNLRAVQMCDQPAVQLDTSIQLVSTSTSAVILPQTAPPD